MKVSLQDLLTYDYTVVAFTSTYITEKSSSCNNYSNKGRFKNMLLYLVEGSLEYYTPKGEKLFTVNANDILFIADNTT